jgi:hypothetical protein
MGFVVRGKRQFLPALPDRDIAVEGGGVAFAWGEDDDDDE